MASRAVIVATARTPIATAHRGSLVGVDAFTLARLAVGEVVRRSGLAPDRIDDVILGESLYGGGAIARHAAVAAGIPEVPGIAHNRHCASGLGAIQSAAASVMAGMDRAVVAGG
ncbi:MAG TPA: acetyl-CoA C-acyltransferase, partial [Acidimicrobiales bacterium]|nr:acetyl-CoA C-acyltransferase [Acidimicrobiales bacterium]